MSLPPAKDYAEYQSVEELLSLQRVRTGVHDEMTKPQRVREMEELVLRLRARASEAVRSSGETAMTTVAAEAAKETT